MTANSAGRTTRLLRASRRSPYGRRQAVPSRDQDKVVEMKSWSDLSGKLLIKAAVGVQMANKSEGRGRWRLEDEVEEKQNAMSF